MKVMQSKGRAYLTAQGVSWVVQGNGVKVFDEVARRSELLAYPESAVWDMACRGHDETSIAASLRWIMGEESRVVGEEEVRACLERWLQVGLLEPADAEKGRG